MSAPHAILTGTRLYPELRVYFDPAEGHETDPDKTLLEWVKELPFAQFRSRRDGSFWLVTATGPNPDENFRDAGVRVDYRSGTGDSPLSRVISLDELVTPISKLSDDGRNAVVLPRLSGFELTKEMLGTGARWDRENKWFVFPAADALHKGKPRTGVKWHPAILEEARDSLGRITTDTTIADAVARASSAKSLKELSKKAVKKLRKRVGEVPDWFGLDLYPFQEAGALAVAAGHNLLADEPGLGKALAWTEPVLTPNGWVRNCDLAVGDCTVGSDGKPTEILGVYDQGEQDIFRVTFDDGSYSRCTIDHLWTVHFGNSMWRATVDTRTIVQRMSLGVTVTIPTVKPVCPGADSDLAAIPERVNTLMSILDRDTSAYERDGAARAWFDSEHEAADFRELTQSLGGTVTLESTSEGILAHVRLPGAAHRRITSITFDGRENARCIRVAAHDSLYVTRDYILTHNTRQAIAAAAIIGSKRTVITCLPVGLTGWKNEVEESLLHTLGGKMPDGEIVVIRAGRKEPQIPDRGVVITSDSLLTSRPALLNKLIEWQPDMFAYDEAHRGKTFTSARSQATIALSYATKKLAVPMSGTPLFASPHELVPILEFSGHLGPVFGGQAAFLDRYCNEDPFGGYRPRKENLQELRNLLIQHVWVRRRKRDVLPDLPKASLFPQYIDVKLTDYNRAYKDVAGVIETWLKEYKKENGEYPDDDTIKAWAMEQVGLVSMLRKAAGVAKVPVAVDIIREHVESTGKITVDGKKVWARPLIVWTHHQDVTEAMSKAVPAAVGESGVIAGGTPAKERDRLVKAFQAGQIPVLVCSISAAGVAITLTRSQDLIFVESDWTPALIRQAIDRAERIGQKNAITAWTLIADGTLDRRIQQVLKQKANVLDILYGDGNDVSVHDADAGDDIQSASKIVIELTMETLAKLNGRKR